MSTKYLLHWNAIIWLWYLSKNDRLSFSSSGFWSEQSLWKQHQHERNNGGAEGPFGLLSVLLQQMSEGGWGHRQKKKKEGEKRRRKRRLKGMCKQENFITGRPGTARQLCAADAELRLSQLHWHVPITVSARLGAVSFPIHVLTDRAENARTSPTPCMLTETLAPRCWRERNRILFTEVIKTFGPSWKF